MLSSSSHLTKEFDSSEHQSLGEVTLPGLPAGSTHFTFPGGAKLTFGQIIALAGDYFGVALEPISLGADRDEKQKRFLAAYRELANCPSDDVYRLTKEFDIEEKEAKSAIAEAKAESDGINKVTTKETEIALKSTRGKYLTLAEHNLDHFNTQAHDAFWTGYELAMTAAVSASKLPKRTAREQRLEHAYKLLAFACHFMTDLFASGHMRAPRAELEATFGAEIGSLLTLFQHNEDGDMGLEVTAKTKDGIKQTWRAYGDGHLFEKKSTENQNRALSTVQEAVNEIHQAFLHQKFTTQNQSALVEMIPTITANNHPPMFKLDANGKLLCRIPIGGEPKNTYTELTKEKAVEILEHHFVKFIEQSIKDRITGYITALKADVKKIKDDFKQLPSQSIFSKSKDANQTNETLCPTPSCCSIM